MEQPALRFVPCREDAHGSKDVCSTVTEIPSFLSRWTQADALINIIPDAALIASGSQNIVEDRFDRGMEQNEALVVPLRVKWI